MHHWGYMEFIETPTFIVFSLISEWMLSESYLTAPLSESMFYELWAAGRNLVAPLFAALTLDISSKSVLRYIVAVLGWLKVWDCINWLVLCFTRQLLVPVYQEIWYTADGARKSSSPASAVSLWDKRHQSVSVLWDNAAPAASLYEQLCV